MDDKISAIISDQPASQHTPDFQQEYAIEEYLNSDLGRATKALPISPWELRDESKLTRERSAYSDPASPIISEETFSSESDEDDFGFSDKLLGDTETGCISPRSLSPRTSHFERPLSHGSDWIPIRSGTPSPLFDHPEYVMTPKMSSPSGFVAFPVPPTPTKRRSQDWEAFINGPAPPCLYECPGYVKSLQSSSTRSTPYLTPSTPTRPSRISEAVIKRDDRGQDRVRGDKYLEGMRTDDDDDDDADDLRISPRLLWRRDDEKSGADDPFL